MFIFQIILTKIINYSFQEKYSGEEKERFMKKMFEYTNPESIQLSPAPQRDLFTGIDAAADKILLTDG